MSTKGIQRARSGLPTTKLGIDGTSVQPSIVFSDPDRDSRHVSNWTLTILQACMIRSGVTRIYVTSTFRSPHDQARVMAANMKQKGTMYRGHGSRVEQVARNIVVLDGAANAMVSAISKLPGVHPATYNSHTRDQIIEQMAAEIERLELQHGQGCVSRHQLQPAHTNVVDIASRALHPGSALAPFIEALTASPAVARIGLPKGTKATHSKHFPETQPCIHVEIPQPATEAPLFSRFRDIA